MHNLAAKRKANIALNLQLAAKTRKIASTNAQRTAKKVKKATTENLSQLKKALKQYLVLQIKTVPHSRDRFCF